MGLAASQCRMLLLTGRRNDVEADLMKISNQLMLLSRDSSNVSDKYSKSLNKTKLTWNAGGTSMDLTYDLLMRPNPYAGSGQYILTNTSNGKVLLNNYYINALGLPASGASGAISSVYSTKEAFAAKMMGLSESDFKTIPLTSGTGTGAGSSPVSGGFSTSYSDADIWNYLASSNSADSNGNYYSSDGSSNVVSVGKAEFLGNNSDLSAVKNMVRGYVNDICSDVSRAIAAKLGSSVDSSKLNAALNDAANATRAYYENDVTEEHSNSEDAFSSGKNAKIRAGEQNGIAVNKNLGAEEIYLDQSQVVKTFLNFFDAKCAALNGDTELASTYMGQMGNGGGDKKSNWLGVTLGVIFGAILTGGPAGAAVGASLGAFISEKIIAKNSENTAASRTVSGGTGSKEAEGEEGGSGGTTTIVNDDKNSNDLSDSYEANYYFNLYSAVNSAGWQSSDNFDSEEFLQNQVLYGSVTIKQLNSSGKWSALTSSSATSPLSSEADEGYQEKAEREYEAEKDMITYKETRLNLRKTMLDSELSSVNTEMQSVSKLLEKHYEDFKLFQNG